MRWKVLVLRRLVVSAAAVVLVGWMACSSRPENRDLSPAELVGDWRAVLESPGGELPFILRVSEKDGALAAAAVNGPSTDPLSSVQVSGTTVRFLFDWYDSEIEAVLDDTGTHLIGKWQKVVPEGHSKLSFRAERLAQGTGEKRFLPLDDPDGRDSDIASVDGTWAVEFRDDSGTEPARGEFRQTGARVDGTFLTPTGDYRFLEGSFERGRLRLSTFDGAHAFLFDATLGADGTLEGDFWSRDSYHATWTARRSSADATVLPDSWSLVGLTNSTGRFEFEFPDLTGQTVSLAEKRFRDKVVIVNIFGSWCPNCNDKAPLLADWYRRYRDRGLEIVGLAYEFTGNVDRDRQMVERFAVRHDIEFPLLLAGISDKAKAGETLPDLTDVIAYPTSVFIGRNGKVRKIHTGFSGPGTGAHYRELVAELEATIESLLEES